MTTTPTQTGISAYFPSVLTSFWPGKTTTPDTTASTAATSPPTTASPATKSYFGDWGRWTRSVAATAQDDDVVDTAAPERGETKATWNPLSLARSWWTGSKPVEDSAAATQDQDKADFYSTLLSMSIPDRNSLYCKSRNLCGGPEKTKFNWLNTAQLKELGIETNPQSTTAIELNEAYKNKKANQDLATADLTTLPDTKVRSATTLRQKPSVVFVDDTEVSQRDHDTGTMSRDTTASMMSSFAGKLTGTARTLQSKGVLKSAMKQKRQDFDLFGTSF